MTTRTASSIITRTDGITITVTIEGPANRTDVCDFPELAGKGASYVDGLIKRNAEAHLRFEPPTPEDPGPAGAAGHVVRNCGAALCPGHRFSGLDICLVDAR